MPIALRALLAFSVLLTACASSGSTKPQSYDGYRRVTGGRDVMYCRPDEILGSKISKADVCYTEAQMQNNARNSEEFFRNVQGANGDNSSSPTPAGR